MKYCTKCGKELEDDVFVCPRCGNQIPEGQKVVYVSSPNDNDATHLNRGVVRNRNSLALAGFICSLVSFFVGGLIAGIVGLVLSCIGRARQKHCTEWNAFATPGMIIGIISCVLYPIFYTIAIVLIFITL